MKRAEVELSARMKALVGLVTPGRVVCDIGCDHGFVSIYLVQKGIAAKVYAMDVRIGPLSRAREHIKAYGLEQQIETRLSDGLGMLEAGEADCAICAGMGGPLMIKILREGSEKVLAMKELILQPQSEVAEFRKYLRTNGYHIIKEDMVFEDGKYYPMMKVIPRELNRAGEESYSKLTVNLNGEDAFADRESACIEVFTDTGQQVFDTYGQYLLEHRHPVLKRYLDHSKTAMTILCDKLKTQQGERAMARLPEMEAELAIIEMALRYFEI